MTAKFATLKKQTTPTHVLEVMEKNFYHRIPGMPRIHPTSQRHQRGQTKRWSILGSPPASTVKLKRRIR